MSTTDDRIVSMQFDNASFESRLSETLKSLDKLNNSIQMAGSKQGLTDVSKSMQNFDTSHMSSALDSINKKFSALGVLGASVIQKLTSGVMGFASSVLNTAKTDILSPIITGGKDRALALQQAKFQFQGLGIDVNAGMASALAAVKGTAYGLNDAATVAAQFGASGIKAGDQMTRALTGISGIAAMTGRSYSEIGQIFTSMAGQGKVSSMDLMEFGIRGVNAAAAYGKETGKTEAQVRQLVSAGKVGFPEFADAMDKAFGEHAKDANQTYAGSLDNVHAAMSRMGASFFSDRLVQERDLFNALTPVIDNLTTALKPLTTEILKVTGEGTKSMVKFLGGINFKPFGAAVTAFIEVVKDGSKFISTYVGIIKKAFDAIFPTGFAEDLRTIAGLFDIFIHALTPTGPAIEKITHIFEGLFAIFSILRNVVRGLFDVFVSFFSVFSKGASEGALNGLNSIAEVLIRLQNYLVFQGHMADFFQKISDYAISAATFIQKLVDGIKNLFGTTSDSGGAQSALDRIGKSFDKVGTVADKLRGVLGAIGTDLSNAWSNIGTWFSQLGTVIANSFQPGAFQGALSAINVGLIAGIGLALKKLFDTSFKFDIGGGMFGQVQSSLKSVNTNLMLLQTDLKAKVLLEIAGAVAVLAAAIVVLSMIKPDALQRSMVAMAVGFAQLVVVMKELDKIGGVGGAAKLTLLGTSMIGMATATLVLAGAVKVMSDIDPNSLAKGLTGIGVAIGLLVGAVKVLSSTSVGMVAAGIAMNAMAAALVIIVGVVRLFSAMSWEEMGKGLAGLAASLLIIAVTMNLMPVASTIAAGLAMIPLAIGLTILAGAVRLFATMSWGELLKGLVGVAAGLVIIAAAMNLMPLSLPLTAAGLILVAVALGLLVPSIKLIGDMNLASLAKGLGGIAVVLAILVVATNAMTGAVVGALALLVVANALLVLSTVLRILGSMSWGDIIKGLVALAGVLVVLGLAALVLEPLIPALLGLGAALTLVGAGFALFGAGAFLVASAFSIMAVAGAAGAAAIIAAIALLLKALPGFLTSLVTSLEQAATTMLTGAGPLLDAIGNILTQVLNLVIQDSPTIAAAIVAIITSALTLIRAKFPDVAQTAIDLLSTILTTIDNNISNVVAEAVSVVVNFADALSKNADKLVTAATNLITSFLTAIAKKAGDIGLAGINILVQFIAGIAKNIGNIATSAGTIITSFITEIGKETLKIVDAGANVIANLITGLGKDADKIVTAGTTALIKFLSGISNNAVKIADACGEAILDFLDGIDKAIRTYEKPIIAEGWQIGKDIISGAINGLTDNVGGLFNTITSIGTGLISKLGHAVGASSPSKKTMEIGKFMTQGLAIGISDGNDATNAAVAQAESILQAFSDSIAKIPNAMDGLNLSPVITPVLDLTKVKEKALGLGDLFTTPNIVPAVSMSQANTIATTTELTKTESPTPPPPPVGDVKFEQNIYSPTALSTNDIYKGTKSQIAQAKEELNI